jgi:IS5 family transposase
VGQEGRQAVFRLQGSCRVDKGSAIIRRVKLTGASVNDTVPADELICGDEAAVYADAAYHTHRREQQLIERGIEAHLMRRANKHHALSEADKERNEAIGQQRAAVEQVFGRMKTTYRWARARCLELARNTTPPICCCCAPR